MNLLPPLGRNEHFYHEILLEGIMFIFYLSGYF